MGSMTARQAIIQIANVPVSPRKQPLTGQEKERSDERI